TPRGSPLPARADRRCPPPPLPRGARRHGPWRGRLRRSVHRLRSSRQVLLACSAPNVRFPLMAGGYSSAISAIATSETDEEADMPPQTWSNKRERQYEHIKE